MGEIGEPLNRVSLNSLVPRLAETVGLWLFGSKWLVAGCMLPPLFPLYPPRPPPSPPLTHTPAFPYFFHPECFQGFAFATGFRMQWQWHELINTWAVLRVAACHSSSLCVCLRVSACMCVCGSRKYELGRANTAVGVSVGHACVCVYVRVLVCV